MKFLILGTLLISLGAGAQSYSTNDGESLPGTFSSKSNEAMKDTSGDSKKVIKRTTTTIEKQEVSPTSKSDSTAVGAGADDKPILDSNSNDETYKVGPLKTGEPDSTIPEEMEAKEEDALDYSTTPDRTVVPPAEVDDEIEEETDEEL